MAAMDEPGDSSRSRRQPPAHDGRPDAGGRDEPLDPDVERYLQHLAVERRLATRTLALYRAALAGLAAQALEHAVALREVQPHHVRRWAARLRDRGLGPRSLALTLSAWRPAVERV